MALILELMPLSSVVYWRDLILFADRSTIFVWLLQSSVFAIAFYAFDPKVVYYFQWQQTLTLFLTCLLSIFLTRDNNGVLKKVFCLKVFTFVGVRCYGVYLIHWPMIWLLVNNTELKGAAVFMVVLPSTLLLAWLMYRYIELPILRRRPNLSVKNQPQTSQLKSLT